MAGFRSSGDCSRWQTQHKHVEGAVQGPSLLTCVCTAWAGGLKWCLVPCSDPWGPGLSTRSDRDCTTALTCPSCCYLDGNLCTWISLGEASCSGEVTGVQLQMQGHKDKGRGLPFFMSPTKLGPVSLIICCSCVTHSTRSRVQFYLNSDFAFLYKICHLGITSG